MMSTGDQTTGQLHAEITQKGAGRHQVDAVGDNRGDGFGTIPRIKSQQLLAQNVQIWYTHTTPEVLMSAKEQAA
jgi:hypothetical protein